MMKYVWRSLQTVILVVTMMSCVDSEKQTVYLATLMTADPGHFHAALVQKVMYPEVNPQVFVYAPQGPDVGDHLSRINGFNTREDDPTSWNTKTYTGEDFFTRMLEEKPGTVLVLAGNNQKKTEYIHEAVSKGLHVFSDKPMAINLSDFEILKRAFKIAEEQGKLLNDMMTERFEITSMLQKELAHVPAIFGEFQTGSPENPAVVKESVHHFFKFVAGNKIKRPPWFFDVEQEGDGIVDVTTHLVDLIQWACYPEVALDYETDIQMIAANRWPTVMTPLEFEAVTRLKQIPAYLNKDLDESGNLHVFSNGEMVYRLRDIHARVKVEWRYQAPEGTGDTHYSILRGTKADLEIRQGAEEKYKPELYILPHQYDEAYPDELKSAFSAIESRYEGIELIEQGSVFRIHIPDQYRVGHEAHFGQVTQQYLNHLAKGKLPDWEVPNCLAKYFTTTAAFEMAKK